MGKASGYLTPEEAATMAGVSVQTIYNWIEKYELGFKIGGRYRISSTSIQRMMQGEGDAIKKEPNDGKTRKTT